jgi:hypothetical protein
MKKEGLIRTIMLVAGFISAVAVVCSQPLSYKTGFNAEKPAAEQSAQKQSPVLQVPGDALPGHATQVDDSSAFHFIATLFEPEEAPELPQMPAERVVHFFEVLFRTLIAPNAP